MRAIIALASFIGAHAPTISAQQRPSGFWAGLSLSAGVLSMSCDDCLVDGTSAVIQAGARAGVSVSRSLLVGIEANRWDRSSSPDEAIELFLVGQWYPSQSSNWYLRGGGGIVWFRGEQRDPREVGDGPGFTLGGGTEFPIGSSTSLGPMLTLTYDAIGDTHISPTRRNVGVLNAMLGATVIFH